MHSLYFFVHQRKERDSDPILPYYYPPLYVPHTANNAIYNEISRELIHLFPSQSSHTILSVPHRCNFFRAKMHQNSYIYTHLTCRKSIE